MINVVILGCGSDGILAAHAAIGDGCDVRILAPEKRAQFIAGPDHLTHNVPGLCKETHPGSIEYRRQGEKGSYGLKVYGRISAYGPWDNAHGIHPLYSLRNAYTAGWGLYHELIETIEINAKTIDSLDADIIINTLPAPLLCRHRKLHRFSEREVWRKSMPVHGQSNRIIYTSDKAIDWYCWAVIENICTWEFMKAPKNLDRHGQLHHLTVPGPDGTTCDCNRDVIHVGRQARWNDLARPHEAYTEMRRYFDRLNQDHG